MADEPVQKVDPPVPPDPTAQAAEEKERQEREAAEAQAAEAEGQSNAEVTKLRKEAAGYRTELRKAQEALKEKEDAEKTDLQKAQGEVDDLKTQIATAETRARKATVLAVAGDVGIVKEARGDAADLLDWSSIEDPTDEKAVEKALKALVKEKPYLAGNTAGGADGGAGGGSGGARTSSMNDLIRAGAGRR